MGSPVKIPWKTPEDYRLLKTLANNSYRDGMVLGTGFFKIGPLRSQPSTARIWHATNIRELTLEQSSYYGRKMKAKPYVLHGSIAYHFNYFIKAFEYLDRVEIIIPWTPSYPRGRLSVDNSIATANSYLKATGKLSSVIGHSDGPKGECSYGFDQLQGQHSRPWDHWFWQAEEGCHLRSQSTTMA